MSLICVCVCVLALQTCLTYALLCYLPLFLCSATPAQHDRLIRTPKVNSWCLKWVIIELTGFHFISDSLPPLCFLLILSSLSLSIFTSSVKGVLPPRPLDLQRRPTPTGTRWGDVIVHTCEFSVEKTLFQKMYGDWNSLDNKAFELRHYRSTNNNVHFVF